MKYLDSLHVYMDKCSNNLHICLGLDQNPYGHKAYTDYLTAVKNYNTIISLIRIKIPIELIQTQYKINPEDIKVYDGMETSCDEIQDCVMEFYMLLKKHAKFIVLYDAQISNLSYIIELLNYYYEIRTKVIDSTQQQIILLQSKASVDLLKQLMETTYQWEKQQHDRKNR